MTDKKRYVLSERIFSGAMIVGLIVFAIFTTHLSATARTVPVWVLITTSLMLIAVLVEDLRANAELKYRFQRPAPQSGAGSDTRVTRPWMDVLLFLSAPVSVYSLGFALGGAVFILTFALVKQSMRIAHAWLSGVITFFILTGLEWLHSGLLS